MRGLLLEEIAGLRKEYTKELRIMQQYKAAQKELTRLNSAKIFHGRRPASEKAKDSLRKIDEHIAAVHERFNRIYEKGK